MANKANAAEWLPRVLFESFLITVSILAALALDEWREDRQDAEMVQQALSNFVSEMQINQVQIEDAALFNAGLLNVLRNRQEENDIATVDEFLNMVESYVPSDLQTTAWETALATGSLANMEYNLVDVLNRTYKKQSRYDITARAGLADLTSTQNLSNERLEIVVYNSIRYLTEVTYLESELVDTYSAATVVINSAISSSNEDGN